jgi:hypothetical protein
VNQQAVPPLIFPHQLPVISRNYSVIYQEKSSEPAGSPSSDLSSSTSCYIKEFFSYISGKIQRTSSQSLL